MNGELPVCTRCCFCLPLRYGLLAWGYFKLIASLFLIIVFSMLMSYTIAMARLYSDKEGSTHFMTDLILTLLVLILLVTDFILTIVFIAGGHKKNLKLLRIYYFYCIVFWVLMIVLTVVVVALVVKRWILYLTSIRSWIIRFLDFAIYFVDIVIQGYFLLLLRSEVIKLRNNCEFRFVNNAAEAECTIIDETEITFQKEETVEPSEKSEDPCELNESHRSM